MVGKYVVGQPPPLRRISPNKGGDGYGNNLDTGSGASNVGNNNFVSASNIPIDHLYTMNGPPSVDYSTVNNQQQSSNLSDLIGKEEHAGTSSLQKEEYSDTQYSVSISSASKFCGDDSKATNSTETSSGLDFLASTASLLAPIAKPPTTSSMVMITGGNNEAIMVNPMPSSSSIVETTRTASTEQQQSSLTRICNINQVAENFLKQHSLLVNGSIDERTTLGSILSDRSMRNKFLSAANQSSSLVIQQTNHSATNGNQPLLNNAPQYCGIPQSVEIPSLDSASRNIQIRHDL